MSVPSIDHPHRLPKSRLANAIYCSLVGMTLTRRLLAFPAFVLLTLLVTFGFALAESVPPSPTDPPKFIQALLDAVKAKNWHLLVALVLIGAVAGLRWLSPKIHGRIGAWLNTQRGGTVLVLLCGVLGAIGTALYGGAKVDVNLILSGVTMGVLASGGWNVLWDLIAPSKTPVDVHSAPTIPIQKVG